MPFLANIGNSKWTLRLPTFTVSIASRLNVPHCGKPVAGLVVCAEARGPDSSVKQARANKRRVEGMGTPVVSPRTVWRKRRVTQIFDRGRSGRISAGRMVGLIQEGK